MVLATFLSFSPRIIRFRWRLLPPAREPFHAYTAVEMKGVKAQKKHEAALAGFFTPINGKLKMRATEIEIEPQGSIGDHLHFGPGIRHLVAGELTLVDADTGKEQLVRAGDYFDETGDRDVRGRTAALCPPSWSLSNWFRRTCRAVRWYR